MPARQTQQIREKKKKMCLRFAPLHTLNNNLCDKHSPTSYLAQDKTPHYDSITLVPDSGGRSVFSLDHLRVHTAESNLHNVPCPQVCKYMIHLSLYSRITLVWLKWSKCMCTHGHSAARSCSLLLIFSAASEAASGSAFRAAMWLHGWPWPCIVHEIVRCLSR